MTTPPPHAVAYVERVTAQIRGLGRQGKSNLAILLALMDFIEQWSLPVRTHLSAIWMRGYR